MVWDNDADANRINMKMIDSTLMKIFFEMWNFQFDQFQNIKKEKWKSSSIYPILHFSL